MFRRPMKIESITEEMENTPFDFSLLPPDVTSITYGSTQTSLEIMISTNHNLEPQL